MAQKKITFDITPEGIKIDTENFSGLTCLTELEKFRSYMSENGIDMKITDQKKKPALYVPGNVSQNKTGVH